MFYLKLRSSNRNIDRYFDNKIVIIYKDNKMSKEIENKEVLTVEEKTLLENAKQQKQEQDRLQALANEFIEAYKALSEEKGFSWVVDPESSLKSPGLTLIQNKKV